MRNLNRQKFRNVERQNPLAEPGSKECVNLLSGNDDDSLEMRSLNGMLDDDNEEKLPDDQLQHVVTLSNVNTPEVPPKQSHIPPGQTPSPSIPPGFVPKTSQSQVPNQTTAPDQPPVKIIIIRNLH